MMAYLTRRENFADGSPPPKKPYSAVQFKNKADVLLQGVYGTGKSSNAFLVDLMQKELDKAVTEGVVTMEEGLEFIKSRKKYYDDYLKEQSKTTDGPIGLPQIEERTEFYKGALVTDGPKKGQYKVSFTQQNDYGNPRFKGVQYGTKKEIEDLIAARDIAAKKSYDAGVDKAKQIQIDRKNKLIKDTVNSFIEKGDYENFKQVITPAQKKRKLPSGNVRQSTGGRVPVNTLNNITAALDAGTDSDLFKELVKVTGKTEQELINFKNNLPTKGKVDVEKRSKAAKESFSEERKTTEEQKAEVERKIQAKRKKRLQTTTGEAKVVKAKNISKKGDFQFHHIKQIGGEAPLTEADIKVIDKVMNGQLAPYNRQLNDIADTISQKITESFEAMRVQNEGKALDLLNEVDTLNTQAEGIVKNAHDTLPEKFKPLIGYNKVYARTDEYGFPLDDKVRIEPIGGGLKKGERSKPLTEYTRKDAANLQTEIDKQVKKLEKISQLKKDIPSLKSGEEIEQPEKSKIRNMFDSFNQKIKNAGNAYRSIRPGIDAFTTMFPGKADNALAAAIDFPMMYMSGAPFSQAAASAGSMFMNNPNIGKMANVALEQAALSEEEQFLKNAMERRQGLESMLEKIPARFRETIEENKGVKDETETYVP
jgi:hypothetical protein